MVFALPIAIFEIVNFQAWIGVFEVLLFVAVTTALLIFIFGKLERQILRGDQVETRCHSRATKSS